MSLLARFQTISDADKEKATKALVEHSTPDFDYFFMITMSVLMASFGFLIGSETIIIGSMLIAPLLSPVLSLALGLSISDHGLVNRSVGTIFKSLLVSVVASMVATVFFIASGKGLPLTDVILSRTTPTLLYLLVAIVSGLAGTYSLVKPKLSETLPGVAISVSLIPPMAVVGIGLANLNMVVALGAFAVFLINTIGVISASMITFSLMNVFGERHIVQSVIKKEAARVEKEEIAVEKADEEVKKETEQQKMIQN